MKIILLKHQIPNKFELPKFQTFSPHPLPLPSGERGLFRDWNLRFVWDYGFVIWNLKSPKPFFQAALAKNSEKPLMVIILIVGAFLIPLTLIIFAANLLSKIGVDHVDETEEKATEMGQMSDAASCSCHGGIKFNEAIDDHKVFSRNREEKVDIDEPIWKEPSIGEEDSIDRSGGSDHRNELIGRENDGANPCPDPAEEEIEQEFSRSPIAF